MKVRNDRSNSARKNPRLDVVDLAAERRRHPGVVGVGRGVVRRGGCRSHGLRRARRLVRRLRGQRRGSGGIRVAHGCPSTF